MAQENKLVEENKYQKPSSGDSNGCSKRREESFPPKLSMWEKVGAAFSIGLLIVALLYLAEQLCLIRLISSLQEEDCNSCTYIAFTLVIVTVMLIRVIFHKLLVHKARREDISKVEALFVEARTVQRPEHGPLKDEKHFNVKKGYLLEEVDRLETKVGSKGWTEYQILALNQRLVSFLDEDELKARARSSLADLEDYAEDSAYRYDQRVYDKWKDSINGAIKKMEDSEDDEKKDKNIETLQAELRTLLEHVASYTANWSKGSLILNGIRICAVVAIPFLLGMALLPIIPVKNCEITGLLSWFNWGILGIIGAVAAVLLNLRKSDYVEVGNTEGRKELWRAIPGIGLGFMAGNLAYWMIAGGLFTSGSIVPDLCSSSIRDIGLSMLWATASGFYFEKIFDQMVSVTLGGSR